MLIAGARQVGLIAEVVINWNFPVAPPSLRFTENCGRNRKHPVRETCG